MNLSVPDVVLDKRADYFLGGLTKRETKEKPPISKMKLAEKWIRVTAAAAIAAVSLDVYVHEDARQAYCGEFQKRFEAGDKALHATGVFLHSTGYGLRQAKVIDIPKEIITYRFPFHREVCYVSIPYVR